MRTVLMTGLMLLISGLAKAELSSGRFQIESRVLNQVASHLQKECPSMYEREFIEVTSYKSYKMDQTDRIYEIEILGRGYAVNDPHWDISYRLEQNWSSDEVVITGFENRGDCW